MPKNWKQSKYSSVADYYIKLRCICKREYYSATKKNNKIDIYWHKRLLPHIQWKQSYRKWCIVWPHFLQTGKGIKRKKWRQWKRKIIFILLLISSNLWSTGQDYRRHWLSTFGLWLFDVSTQICVTSLNRRNKSSLNRKNKRGRLWRQTGKRHWSFTWLKTEKAYSEEI